MMISCCQALISDGGGLIRLKVHDLNSYAIFNGSISNYFKSPN